MPLTETEAAPMATSLRGLPILPDDLALRLERCQHLPSLPATVLEVLELSRRPDMGPADLAGAIERDPALTLRMVALANSAFYTRRDQEVATCHEAASRLGTDATLAAAMSFGLGQRDLPDHFWHRGVTAAVAARELAHQLCPEAAGRLFTAALLQDVGILALRALDGERYGALLHRHPQHATLIQAEQATYGCDHARVGAWLTLDWGASLGLARRIADSHGPLATDDPEPLCLRLSGPVADAWLADDPSLAFAKLARTLEGAAGAEAPSLERILEELRVALPSLAELFALTRLPDLDEPRLLLEGKRRLVDLTLRLSARLDEHHHQLDALRRENDALDLKTRLDPLTGLANRGWLEYCIDRQLQAAAQGHAELALLFIDLDHFKALNDRHGHNVGDAVLVQLAATLVDLIREGDLAGRYGGEEFVVLLPGETGDGALRVAQRLLERLAAQPMAEVEGRPLHVSASIGIASLETGPFHSALQMIDAADRQMYRAKRDGRSQIASVKPA